MSKLRKVESHDIKKPQKDHKMLPKNQFKLRMDKALQKDAAKYIKEQFGIVIDPIKHFFIASKEKVYLCSPQFKDIQKKLHCEKTGTPVMKIDRKYGFRPMH